MRPEAASGRASPYKGLQPFGLDDGAFFSGRARDIRLIVAGMFASRVTLLYGPSGVGKSSVLYAGVLPQLAQRKNVLAVGVRDWSDDPLRSIGEAVARAAGTEPVGDLGELLSACSGAERRRIMLVLDQFEHALGEREAAEALVEGLSAVLLREDIPVCALIAIREDALADLDRFDGRLPGVFDSALRLEYLDRAAGEAAIRRPLAAWEHATGEHVDVEDGLVEAVLDAVPAGRAADGIETAQLQLVMARVWEAERAAGSSLLHRATFDALGGADGIVRTHVRDALDGMADADRDLAAVVLDRLVTPSGARISHLTDDLARYADSDATTLRPVLERLSTARVLRPVAAGEGGGARFEVYHELLADAVLAWLTDHEADRRAATASARLRKRILSLVVVAAIAAVIAVVLAGALIAEKRSSETARAGATSATARRLLASGGDPQLALALALRAAETRPTRDAQLALRAALAQSFERAVLRDDEDGVLSVDVSPDGRTLLVAGADGAARIRDEATGKALGTPVATGAVRVAFCPDRRRVAVAGDEGAVLVAGGARRRLASDIVDAVSCSADGARVAIRETERARVFDARTGRVVATLRAPTNHRIGSVALSADGRRVATAVAGGTLVADLRAGGRRAFLGTQGYEVTAVALSPDGRRVVTGDEDGTVLVRDVSHGFTVKELKGNASSVLSVAYSPDGTLVVSAAADRVARVWDAAGGVQLAELRGHDDVLHDAVIARDGRTVATASDDGTVRLWRLPVRAVLRSGSDLADGVVAGDGRHVVVATSAGAIEVSDLASGRRTARLAARGVARVAVAPRADRVAAIDRSGRVRAWDPARPTAPVDMATDEDAVALAYSPDGRTLAVTTLHNELLLVDRAGRRRHVRRVARRGGLGAVAFSPDGSRIAVAADDEGAIVVLDGASGRRIAGIRSRDPVNTIAFSPDGGQVIAATGDGAAIWDVASGRPRLRLRGHRSPVLSAMFDPRADLVVTSSDDGETRLWDADSGDLLTSLVGSSAAFAGDRLLTTFAGVARLYDCDICGTLAELQARGRARVTRKFTASQLSP